MWIVQIDQMSPPSASSNHKAANETSYLSIQPISATNNTQSPNGSLVASKCSINGTAETDGCLCLFKQCYCLLLRQIGMRSIQGGRRNGPLGPPQHVAVESLFKPNDQVTV